MNLVRSDLLEAKEAAFDAVRGRLLPSYNLALLDDPLAGQALKFYLLLTEMPDLLAGERPSAEELFWSRYSWFMRYARLRRAVAGYDAGLEQQAAQILEYPHPACTPDWSVLEEVEAAELDAGGQLRLTDGAEEA